MIRYADVKRPVPLLPPGEFPIQTWLAQVLYVADDEGASLGVVFFVSPA